LLVQGLQKAAISMVTRELAMFLLLTWVRANEAAAMKWEEIDEENRCWTIPPARMKTRDGHKVPLSDGALSILRRMKEIRQNQHVFPGRSVPSHANPASVAVALKRAGINSTAHGFRSLAATYSSERSSFSTDAIEGALSHRIGGVRGAYTRTTFFEERRLLMDWFCAEVTKAGASATE
jgi:integrase